MLKILELFGGIGACSKAIEKLGIDYEIADYVEIDKYAVKSFNAIHNTNFEPQDITTWNKDIEVDLVMHGSPCQDFSLAGLQAGGDEGSGTRSSLMYETIRIVKKLKPKYVIWENVKNLLSKKHRHNFDSYLDIMESLGYKNYYQVLNAKDYGIPQNRERVFTVSIRKDIQVSNEIKPSVRKNFEREKQEISKTNKEIYQCECESGWQDNKVGIKVSPTIRANNNNTFILEDNIDFEFPPKQELKLKLKDMLEDNVDEKYYLSDKMINYCMGFNQKESKFPRKERFLQSLDMTNNREIATTISTNAGNRPVDNFVIDNRNMKEQLCDELIRDGKVQENDMIRHSYTTWRKEKEFHTENSRNNNISATLTTRPDTLGIAVKNNTKQGYLMAYPVDGVYTNTSTKRGTVQKEMIQTLTTFQDKGVVMNDLRIRKLTPKECWRLMGFDDEDFDKASKVNSNAQLYKQAGNSIVVNVLMAIFKELL